ncbi:MAG: hypothetical protein AVDCRST_MAG18-1078, partial [uncultured Thermomicrobiales bacterium]
WAGRFAGCAWGDRQGSVFGGSRVASLGAGDVCGGGRRARRAGVGNTPLQPTPLPCTKGVRRPRREGHDRVCRRPTTAGG